MDPRASRDRESVGGTHVLLSAIDDRIAVSFPMVMVSGAMQGGCVCENAPLLRIGTNNIELAALFAPKPLGMSAANDWTKDLLTRGLPEIKTIYGLFGATDRVTAVHQPFEHGDHLLSRELMYSWFSTHLKPTGPHTGAIVEPPFTPVPPADLSVFDAAHPRPSDTLAPPRCGRYLTLRRRAEGGARRGARKDREVVSTRFSRHDQDPFASRVEVIGDKEELRAPAPALPSPFVNSELPTARQAGITPRSHADPGGNRGRCVWPPGGSGERVGLTGTAACRACWWSVAPWDRPDVTPGGRSRVGKDDER